MLRYIYLNIQFFYFRGQPKYSAESSYKPGTRKVSHPMEVTGYKGYKDVFVSKDVITPIESKTMDLIVVDSYKVSNIY